jgi:hypothetical protein
LGVAFFFAGSGSRPTSISAAMHAFHASRQRCTVVSEIHRSYAVGGKNSVEQRPCFRRIEHRRLTGRHDVPRAAHRVRIDVSGHAGLRDRALIGLMVYSFARIGERT